ncbi:hypothetical protein EGR_07808 [Echinococcus granulosus]|uniref:Uncharacterized protein n=1 Tax=Echinococcus granulosus TaxID=6210 RepID=W6UV85_ECHGR|nr:hypothetical protein EGR_07808 [Echinococcus granulosus]EUB57349.1 hypothetical protein EGR_07808 [Echinococcus granulosus]
MPYDLAIVKQSTLMSICESYLFRCFFAEFCNLKVNAKCNFGLVQGCTEFNSDQTTPVIHFCLISLSQSALSFTRNSCDFGIQQKLFHFVDKLESTPYALRLPTNCMDKGEKKGYSFLLSTMLDVKYQYYIIRKENLFNPNFTDPHFNASKFFKRCPGTKALNVFLLTGTFIFRKKCMKRTGGNSHTAYLLLTSKDREIDFTDIWNYACREIQRSLEQGKVKISRHETPESIPRREKVKSLINLLKLDAFSEPPSSTHISRHQSKSSRSIPRRNRVRKSLKVKYSRDRRDIREFAALTETSGKLKVDRRHQKNLSNMEENSSEVEMPRRRTSRRSKPVKRPAKQQLQQNHRFPSNRSQPHGDEASFTQSQIHNQVQGQTEFDAKSNDMEQNLRPSPEGTELGPTATNEVTGKTEEDSCLQGEKIIIAIERTDQTADLSQSVEDLDLKEFKSQDVGDLVCQDDLDFVSSGTNITRMPTTIAELISQRRGFKSKENLFAQMESFNKALKKSLLSAPLSPLMADCVPLVNFTLPKYESMRSIEVLKNRDERNYIFTSHLIISASAHALPLPKMIAEYFPRQAAFSVILESTSEGSKKATTTEPQKPS